MAFWRSDMTGRVQRRRKAQPCQGCAEKSRQIALLNALVTEQAAAIDAHSTGYSVEDSGTLCVPDVEKIKK